AFQETITIPQADIQRLKPGYTGAKACVQFTPSEDKKCTFFVLHISLKKIILTQDLQEEKIIETKPGKLQTLEILSINKKSVKNLFPISSFWQIETENIDTVIKIHTQTPKYLIGNDRFKKSHKILISNITLASLRSGFIKFHWSDWRNTIPGYSQSYYQNKKWKSIVLGSIFVLSAISSINYFQRAQKSLRRNEYYILPNSIYLYRNKKNNNEFQSLNKNWQVASFMTVGVYMYHLYDLYSFSQAQQKNVPQNSKLTQGDKNLSFQLQWHHYF
ncbi:MAG: hypothetical protein AAF518_13200, partial [Spirochaetota bacterium]